MPEFTTSV